MLPEQQALQKILSEPVLSMYPFIHTSAQRHVLYTSASLEAHLEHVQDSTRWQLTSGHASKDAR